MLTNIKSEFEWCITLKIQTGESEALRRLMSDEKNTFYFLKLKIVDSLAPCYTLWSLFWCASVSHRNMPLSLSTSMICQRYYRVMKFKFAETGHWRFHMKRIFHEDRSWVIFYVSKCFFIFVVKLKPEFTPFFWKSYKGLFEGYDIKYMSFLNVFIPFVSRLSLCGCVLQTPAPNYDQLRLTPPPAGYNPVSHACRQGLNLAVSFCLSPL